jgi:hypothetical protein
VAYDLQAMLDYVSAQQAQQTQYASTASTAGGVLPANQVVQVKHISFVAYDGLVAAGYFIQARRGHL